MHVNVYFNCSIENARFGTIEARRIVSQALVISRLTYALASFEGFFVVWRSDIAHLNAVFRKAVRWGIIDNLYDISNFVNNTQTRLFKQIVNNSDHCLHH